MFKKVSLSAAVHAFWRGERVWLSTGEILQHESRAGSVRVARKWFFRVSKDLLSREGVKGGYYLYEEKAE